MARVPPVRSESHRIRRAQAILPVARRPHYERLDLRVSATARRIALYACLVAALMGYAFVEGRASEQTAEAVDYSRTILAGSHAFLDRLRGDSLTISRLARSEVSWVALEGHWRHVADSLAADTLDIVTPGTNTQTPPLTPTIALGRSLDACDASRAASDSARALLATDLALCKARGDTLETALRRLIAVRSPRFGFTVGPAILGDVSGSVHAGIAVVFGYRF